MQADVQKHLKNKNRPKDSQKPDEVD